MATTELLAKEGFLYNSSLMGDDVAYILKADAGEITQRGVGLDSLLHRSAQWDGHLEPNFLKGRRGHLHLVQMVHEAPGIRGCAVDSDDQTAIASIKC